jgi:hypothetical protein
MSQDIGNTAQLESRACRKPAWSLPLLSSRAGELARLPAATRCRRVGWSRLVARYRVEGEAAFEPRYRRPHSQPTAIPMATVALIIRLRSQLVRQGLDAGSHTIAWHLVEQY